MKIIQKVEQAGALLGIADWKTSLLWVRTDGGLFEYRFDRRRDTTQTTDTIAHLLIEAGKAINCIVGIAKAAYEQNSVGKPDNRCIVVIQFTLEQKDEPKGKPGAPYRGKVVTSYRTSGIHPFAYECRELTLYDRHTRVDIERAIDEVLNGSASAQAEGGRQWICVYVDNDADAAAFMQMLDALKAGQIGHLGLIHVAIPSLDWDSFEPSSPEDEQWRQK